MGGLPFDPAHALRDGTYHFLAPLGDLRTLSFRDLTRNGIATLFAGDLAWLTYYCPAFDKEGKPTGGWSHDLARDRLVRMCVEQGFFSPAAVTRGPGAWIDNKGRLVVHTGRELFIGGKWYPAGRLIGGLLFPAATPETKPADTPATAAQCAELLAFLGRWSWRAPREAPRILLGFLGQAFVTGALRWRSHVWLAGDKATGKTHIIQLIKAILDTVIINSSAATEAGIRQAINADHSARAVELDEMEQEAGSTRVNDMIKLCRIASSGADTHRGSAGGAAQTYRLNCCVLLSSIYFQRFLPQDAGRICVLELDRLPVDEKQREAVIAGIEKLGELGPAIYRRMVDGWDRLQANLATFRTTLSLKGRSSRVSDQFGTLLACAETLLSDVPVTAGRAAELLAALDIDAVTDQHPEEGYEQCFNHLMSSETDIRGDNGRRKLLGEVLDEALKLGNGDKVDLLKHYGLKLVRLDPGSGALAQRNDLALNRL